MTDRPRRTPRRAFTLIELLVVVAVLVILISILAPSLAGARRAAQQSQCSSNLRQFGLAANAHANDNDDLLCTGRFSNARNKNWGSIIQKGWVADFVRGEYAKPGGMLCPSSVAQSCQTLKMNEINAGAYADPATGSAFTRNRVDEIIRQGYNTNYTQSWYMAYTGVPDHATGGAGSDPGKTSGVLGPLKRSRLSRVSPSIVPLLGDGRTGTNDTGQVGNRQLRTVKDLTDGPVPGGDGFAWGRQDYDDFGPSHGKGTFISSLFASENKGHDSSIANFLFADGHVDSFLDANRDGEFASRTDENGKTVYDDLEGRIFGGWLTQSGVNQ